MKQTLLELQAKVILEMGKLTVVPDGQRYPLDKANRKLEAELQRREEARERKLLG